MQRRRFLAALGGAAASATAGCGGLVSGGSDDETTPAIPDDVAGSYTGLQGGPRHVGDRDGTVEGDLEPVWSASEPSTEPGHHFGTPAVADGIAYVPEGTVRDETATAYVTALDLASGDREWQFEFPGTNAVDHAVYHDGTLLQRFSGSLVAIDAAGGEELWRLSADLDGTPAAADGRVFVAGADLEGTTLYALDVQTGDELWTRDVGGGRGRIPAPAVADGVVYNAESSLVGLDATDGTEVWTGTTDESPGTAPTVTDDAVYVGTSGNGVAAVDRESGDQRWWREVATAGTGGGRRPPSSPAVADGAVFATSSWAGTALDADSGEERWTEEVGANGPPVVAGDAVFVGGIDECRSFAVDDGSPRQEFLTENSSGSTAPAVLDGVVLYPSDELYALSGV